METQPAYQTETKYPREIDWSTYKFRCSMLGDLMPGPRAKEGQLQATELSALRKLWIQAVYGVTEDVSTKQMDKGTIQESEGISLMTAVRYPGQFIPKNTQRFENEYLTGEPDVCVPSISKVHDIKCPWSLRTFMESEMTKGYEWQLRAYMWLKNYANAELNYTLVDAPEEMILKEQVFAFMNRGIYILDWRESDPKILQEYIDEACKQNPTMADQVHQIRHNMTFGYVHIEKRVKSFVLTRDESLEQQIRDRALLWRSELAKMEL